tara:strand:+ start:533 stop:814 length:282 start_codon:yes stop_codon:yes gene_type:complete
MKTTNAIENALKNKASNEINDIVDTFINDIKNKVVDKYKSNAYSYDLGNDTKDIHIQSNHLKGVLVRMLSEKHLNRMVECKSAELIKKLDLEL